ncbi:class GN sortase [Porticoccaceae bacterium LTM1]|nr:class GN sortase [Porticoccaceae bacterium LTM1]
MATVFHMSKVALGLMPKGVSPFFLLRNWRRHLAAVLALFAIALIVDSLYIHAKAQLGQYLIRSAWKESLEKGEQVKPWCWADTWPVARLHIPKLNVDQVVLAGDNGQALAFGPGLISTSSGGLVVSGHRDTHFSFLEHITLGSVLEFQYYKDSGPRRFQVTELEVVNIDDTDLYVPEQSLLLYTCWPFRGVELHTPWRYLAIAVPQIRSETENE